MALSNGGIILDEKSGEYAEFFLVLIIFVVHMKERRTKYEKYMKGYFII